MRFILMLTTGDGRIRITDWTGEIKSGETVRMPFKDDLDRAIELRVDIDTSDLSVSQAIEVVQKVVREGYAQ